MKTRVPLVDVHCHLDAPQFSEGLDGVLERARRNGVVAVLSNGTNPESNRRVLELSIKYPIVKPVLGFYPNDAAEEGLSKVHKEIDFIKENSSRIAAIGEVGLDLHHDNDKEHFAIMKETFILLARLARKLDKPLIVHSRKAELETIEVLEAESAKKVVFHCFGGKMKLAERVIKNGWYLSIPANINRSSQFQEFVKSFPLSQLLTETDAPFLSPEGREARNEPANVKLAAEEMAKLKGLTFEETANQLYMNYQRLFRPAQE